MLDVGIISVKTYDDLALEAWTQRGGRERSERDMRYISIVYVLCDRANFL